MSNLKLVPLSKKCPKCGEEKGASEFYKTDRTNDGLYGYCKPCTKQYRDENPKKKEQSKGQRLKYKFGITLDDYNKMFAEQGGCCAICGDHQSNHQRAFAVDHCHDTGKVRGLLCINCNTGIGKLNDDPALLRIAISYLEK